MSIFWQFLPYSKDALAGVVAFWPSVTVVSICKVLQMEFQKHAFDMSKYLLDSIFA